MTNQENSDKALLEEFHLSEESLKSLRKKLKKSDKKPERGIETMYRLASKNLYTRAGLADNKANIMISINAIILTVILGSLYTQLDEDPHLIMPIVTLLIANLVSIAFAVVATRPVISNHAYSREDFESKKATLMTFDDFKNMSQEDFEWAMEKITNDAQYLYLNITRDIYSLGIILSKKYRFLRYSYNVFLYGLIMAVILFVLCHLMYDPNIFSS